METDKPTDTLAEDLLRSIRSLIPSASLGFPSGEDLDATRLCRWSHLQTVQDRRFQELKRAALANVKKDPLCNPN